MAYSTKKKTDELVAKLQKQLAGTRSNMTRDKARIKLRISKLRSEEAARKAERTKPGYKGNRYGYKAIEGPRVALTGEKGTMKQVSPEGTSGKTASPKDAGPVRSRPGASKPKVSKAPSSKPDGTPTTPKPVPPTTPKPVPPGKKPKKKLTKAQIADFLKTKEGKAWEAEESRLAKQRKAMEESNKKARKHERKLQRGRDPGSLSPKKNLLHKTRKLDKRLANRNRTLGVRA